MDFKPWLTILITLICLGVGMRLGYKICLKSNMNAPVGIFVLGVPLGLFGASAVFHLLKLFFPSLVYG
jgi:hypothetical protein